MSNAAIAKRRAKLLAKGIDIGEPLTREYTSGGGVVSQGYYAGQMVAYPDVDEAWFVQDIESPLPEVQS